MTIGVIEGLGAVVLAGGRSTRMGRSKAAIDFAGEPLVARVARRLAPVCRVVVVAAAPEQELPALPEGVRVARDAVAGRGPLAGIAAGLAALGPGCDAAFVTTTDAPFVAAAVVRRLAALRGEGEGAPWEAVVPVLEGRAQPLSAVYAAGAREVAEALLAAGSLRAGRLAEALRARFVDEATLLDDPRVAAGDPTLATLRGVNTPEELASALARADDER
jgi:molybdopterin-guanine dinucleotide biosynthesis protein A